MVAVALAAGPAQAAGIEGRWSVNEGEVTVTANQDGSFTGTVTAATRQACPKPVGEVIWTEVRAQSDGSYWGKSQFYNQETCARTGQGPNAFRVLRTASGAEYLKGCFSQPGGAQPTIAADGSTANADSGCVDFPRIGASPSRPEALILVDAVVRKARGRRWKVVVSGRIQLPSTASASNCSGPVSIRVRFRTRRVAGGTASVGASDCRFRRTFRIRRSKARRGKLRVTATWPGTSEVAGGSGTFTARIPRR